VFYFWVYFFSGLATSLLIFLTWRDLQPFSHDLMLRDSEVKKVQILDRAANPLTVTYQNDWNLHDNIPLHQIPETLQHIIVLSEDQRFYEHSGADWSARWHALFQNIKAGRIVRGASTITEQTVRMLHPRPRTFWSRWVEGFEAYRLEQQFSKADILEFYLNQVPYASNRRGVVQAARHYFDRDLDTLSLKEMVVLAVLVRSPSRLDLRHGNKNIRPSLEGLTKRLFAQALITESEYQTILNSPLQLNDPQLLIQASHFANYLYRHSSFLSRKTKLNYTRL
jgi:penicillin-binding protein 1C